MARNASRRSGLVRDLALRPHATAARTARRRRARSPRATSCDESVDEERLRHVAVHADHLFAVGLRQHARTIGPREQHVVPLRQEANGRRGVGVRERRAGDVEELAAVLVAEAAERLEPLERARDLRDAHHRPRPDVLPRRRPERREIATEDLRAGLGRIEPLRVVERDESPRGARAPESRFVVVHEVRAHARRATRGGR